MVAAATAAIGIGGSIFNGLNQKKGAKDAANAQIMGAMGSLNLQKQGYDLQQGGMDRALGLYKSGLNRSLALQQQGLKGSTALINKGLQGALGYQQKGLNASQAWTKQGLTYMAPWLNAGKKALAQLQIENGLMKGTSTFHATPGYQFQVDEGQKGVMNNLAALGMKNSGSALKALTRFREGLADQEYNNYYNRIAGIASGGQQAAGTSADLAGNMGTTAANAYNNMGTTYGNALGAQGAAYGNAYGNMGSAVTSANNNMGSTITNTTNGMANTLGNMGNTLENIGTYRASGYAGGTNALTGMVNGVTNTLGNSLGYLNKPGGLY